MKRYQVPSLMSEIVEAPWQYQESCFYWPANRLFLYPDMSEKTKRSLPV